MNLHCFCLIFLVALISFPTKGQMNTFQKVQANAVLFDFGKYNIRQDADSVLQEVVTQIQEQSSLHIHLQGHTDAIGSSEANLLLSKNRAIAVQEYLLDSGIDSSKIHFEGYGEGQPIAENDSDEGRQLNRRVALTITRSIKLVKLEGKVKDSENGKGIEAEVIVRTRENKDTLQTDTTGTFTAYLSDSTVAGVDVYAKGFFLETKMFKVQAGRMPLLEISLPPVREGEVVDIKNLYFVGNEAVLLKRSEPELPKILKFMQINPEIKIEIAGHINYPNSPPVAKNSWNFNLSVRRAKLVFDYLIKNGILDDRISFQGYGNFEMRFPKAHSSKQQELNRRVEIRVLETGKN